MNIQRTADQVQIPVSIGELVDRISILEIKLANIVEEAKLVYVRAELLSLRQIHDAGEWATPELTAAYSQLKSTNEELWKIEDEIRKCEARRDFGSRFIELARRVYKTNDCRAELKSQINEMTGSMIREVKEYSNS
ncbi:DUF6165 family protein [Planctomycetota bacterium]